MSFVWWMYFYVLLCVFLKKKIPFILVFFLFDSSGHIRGSLHVRDSAAITPRFPLLPGPLVRRGQPGHRHRRHLRRQAASWEFPPSRQPATVSLLGRSPERLECRLRGLPRRHDRHPRLHYGGALARSPGPVRLLRALFEAPRHHPLCAVGFDGRDRAAGHGVPRDWGRGGVSRIGVRAARHGVRSWGGATPWLKTHCHSDIPNTFYQELMRKKHPGLRCKVRNGNLNLLGATASSGGRAGPRGRATTDRATCRVNAPDADTHDSRQGQDTIRTMSLTDWLIDL